MEENIKVVFFDLFFTLIVPKYNDIRNENDVLGISQEEWEVYAENQELYLQRAVGKVDSPEEIMDHIIKKMGIPVTASMREEILQLRTNRIKRSLLNIDNTILKILKSIKEKQKKLCLISNADLIDTKYWKESPLYKLFDGAIFSHEAGYLKPQPEIYKLALDYMKVKPEQCIFIGDGGSEELRGAKEAGIKTILTDYLLKREKKELMELMKWADYYITDFREIIQIV